MQHNLSFLKTQKVPMLPTTLVSIVIIFNTHAFYLQWNVANLEFCFSQLVLVAKFKVHEGNIDQSLHIFK